MKYLYYNYGTYIQLLIYYRQVYEYRSVGTHMNL